MSDHSEKNTTDGPDSRGNAKARMLTGWALVIPAVLLGGVIWFNSRSSSTDDLEAASNSTIVTSGETPQGGGAASREITLFIMNDDAKLAEKKAPLPEGMVAPTSPTERGRLVVEALLRERPDDYPKGSKVSGVTQQGEQIDVDLNRAFTAPEFWQGSARTLSTVYSIVNSLTQQQYEGATIKKVRFLIEGKPIDALGELDVSTPLEPDTSLVAKG